MDVTQLRQRSVSHSSLHSTYRAHGRPSNYTNPRPPPKRRPLRSVNENVALLRSPGPLESMLKTTTETGDIGIFSIKPASIPPTYLPPTRLRPHHGDAGLLPTPRSRGYDDNYFQDDHKRLRSYRDTTSEIISLYGSDSHQTLLTSVSPSLDDGYRTYSMTTTSSKQIPSQKSSGTLQSQSSGGGFQRPRSPFPYPTRLKRPGVRPASPALAENGDIDYSRMVELDRFSQRTVHGSYKPSYSHGPRRPPPPFLRGDVNRSTTSLPSRTSPSPYYYVSVPGRVRTPSSSVSWTSRPSERHQRGSADQSTRSASLTSIVEMYNRPIPGNVNCPPLRSTGSFYYDYSEEFENQPPHHMELEIPICPIPQRAGSIRRPMVLMDDTHVSLDAAENESDSAKPDLADVEKEEQPCSKIDDNLDAQHRLDEKNPVLDLDDDLAVPQPPTLNRARELPSISVVHEEEDRPVSPDDKLQGSERAASEISPATCDTPYGKPSSPQRVWQPSTALAIEQDAGGPLRSRRSSQSSLSKLRCTLDPALSDFASILSSFDRLGKSPLSKKGGDVRSASEDYQEASRYEDDEHDTDGQKRLSRRPSLPLFDQVDLESRAYRKRHRRNIAAMRISTTGVTPEEPAKDTHGPREDIQILSPEPISPVRELRVKYSIPQLMKALPPLPREAEGISGSGVADVALPADYPDYGVLALSRERHGMRNNHLDMKLLPSPDEAPRTSQESLAKFKIRVKASPSPYGADNIASSTNGDKPEHNICPEQGSSLAARPKLKLKVSRSQLGQARTGQNGSALHNRLKQCNSLAELAPGPRKNASATIRHLDEGDEEQVPKSCSGNDSLKTSEKETSRPEPSPQPSDQFNIPYPPSPDKVEAILHPRASTHKVTFSETCSVKSDDGPSEQHGLRSKLSMFLLRLIGTQPANSLKKSIPAPLAATPEPTTPPTMVSSEGHANRDLAMDEKSRAASTRSDKAGWRVKRWARGAKRAVRSYVRRTLDRSSSVSD